jgi:hypothetical protein
MFQPAAIAEMEIRSSFEFITDGRPVQAKRIDADRWIITGRSVALGECVKGVVVWRPAPGEFGRAWQVVEFDADANSQVVADCHELTAAISDAVTYVAN